MGAFASAVLFSLSRIQGFRRQVVPVPQPATWPPARYHLFERLFQPYFRRFSVHFSVCRVGDCCAMPDTYHGLELGHAVSLPSVVRALVLGAVCVGLGFVLEALDNAQHFYDNTYQKWFYIFAISCGAYIVGVGVAAVFTVSAVAAAARRASNFCCLCGVWVDLCCWPRVSACACVCVCLCVCVSVCLCLYLCLYLCLCLCFCFCFSRLLSISQSICVSLSFFVCLCPCPCLCVSVSVSVSGVCAPVCASLWLSLARACF